MLENQFHTWALIQGTESIRKHFFKKMESKQLLLETMKNIFTEHWFLRKTTRNGILVKDLF